MKASVVFYVVSLVSIYSCLFPAILLAGVFLGSLDTASNSLVLYMLGPDRSPPFTQSLHAMVALGFMLGSLVIRPFLPDNQVRVLLYCKTFLFTDKLFRITMITVKFVNPLLKILQKSETYLMMPLIILVMKLWL